MTSRRARNLSRPHGASRPTAFLIGVDSRHADRPFRQALYFSRELTRNWDYFRYALTPCVSEKRNFSSHPRAEVDAQGDKTRRKLFRKNKG